MQNIKNHSLIIILFNLYIGISAQLKINKKKKYIRKNIKFNIYIMKQ